MDSFDTMIKNQVQATKQVFETLLNESDVKASFEDLLPIEDIFPKMKEVLKTYFTDEEAKDISGYLEKYGEKLVNSSFELSEILGSTIEKNLTKILQEEI